jgi:hypothetical protein
VQPDPDPDPDPDPAPGFWTRRKWPCAVVAISAVLLAGSATALILSADARHGATEQARKTAIAFATDLRSHDYAAAFALLCAQDQSNRAEFLRYWDGQAAAGKTIAAYHVVSLNVSSRSGEGSGHALLAVQYTNGTSASLTLALAEHRHIWFPCP